MSRPGGITVELERFVDHPEGRAYGVATGLRLPERQPVYVAIPAIYFELVLEAFHLRRRNLLRRNRTVHVVVGEDLVAARESYRTMPPWWTA